jgi:hypothetical protein
MTWPVGIALTSFDYLWRTTPLHRIETVEHDESPHLPPPLPQGIDRTEIIRPPDGAGPLFHRRYVTDIRDGAVDADDLFKTLTGALNRAVPLKMARFHKVLGDDGTVDVGDEYVVRMPGPWDGPVRVIDRGPRSLRLATLAGHLEAGQIEFSAQPSQDGMLRFTIESWTRSADGMSNLLYHRLRMAKEIQAHMWISFLENVVKISGGRMTGGVTITTRRVEGRA